MLGKYIVRHESFKCKCRSNQSVCNSKQKYNHEEYWSEWKELDQDDYMWNPRKCDCEWNKACKIDEYLDIKNCSCEKRLIGKLVLACEGEISNTTETSLDDKK